jgi:predicted dehydrogenase
MTPPIDRRKFMVSSTLATAGTISLPSLASGFHIASAPVQEKVRIGFIGTGLRGRNHVNNILDHEGVVCPAFCDIDPDAVQKTQQMVGEKTGRKATVYTGSEQAYLEMLEKEDLDGVIIATNWKWHTPMCQAAMEAGIYTGVEVSGAFTIQECWDLVDTHERTGTHLMFLENVNYRRDVLAVLNMVRDDLFGELIHCRGGYQHDLRSVKFNDGKGGLVFGEGAYGEARWRTSHSIHRNGELYPTHGLGPVNAMLDINRGNRLVTLSSVATKSRGLKAYITQHPEGGTDHPYQQINWSLGDIVTSTITTANGETIILTHDTNLPRPYSLGFRVQGVEGLAEFDYYNRRVYVEGKSNPHRWDEWEVWFKQYDHPLWQEYGEEAVNKGHGGMDFFLDRAFVEGVKNQVAPVLDVYDAATLRVITPLSEQSIREGGAPQQIPDFTRGNWMHRLPVFGKGAW